MKRGNSGIVFRANSGWTAKMGKGGRGGKKEERQGCFNGFESASK